MGFAFLIVLLVIFFAIAFMPSIRHSGEGALIAFIPIFPIALILDALNLDILTESVLSFITVTILTYFLVGALIGWIVGKIKSRKQK